MERNRSRFFTAVLAASASFLLAGTFAWTVQGGSFSVTPSSVDFGDVQVGTSSQVDVTVTNISPATVGPISMAGGAVAAPFGAGQNCANATLPPGGTCTIQYTFSPTTAGPASATSDFSLDGEQFSVQLSGNGIGARAEPIPTMSGKGLAVFIGFLGLLGATLLWWRRT